MAANALHGTTHDELLESARWAGRNTELLYHYLRSDFVPTSIIAINEGCLITQDNSDRNNSPRLQSVPSSW
jgi:hypothetical protein